MKNLGIKASITLCIVFAIFKLTGTGAIGTWSWLWIISPLWIFYGIKVLLWGFLNVRIK